MTITRTTIRTKRTARKAARVGAKPKVRYRTLRLPGLRAFKALSIAKRRALFLRWAKTKAPEKEYDYHSCDRCALSQFGKAIAKGRAVKGAGYEFAVDDRYIDVIGKGSGAVCRAPWNFGALVQRLQAEV